MQYGQDVRRPWLLASRYGFDALIVAAAVEGTLEVVLSHGSPQAPRTPLWFAAPATAIIVLPLLARRQFPIAGPAAVWLVSAAVSFADGRLVVFPTGIYIAGLAAAFLLGNSADAV